MITCTNCNAPIRFLSGNSSYYACTSCRTVQEKTRPGMTSKFVSEAMAEDMTPLMIGSEGVVENKKFTVAGRVRFIYADAYINQWSIVFADDTMAFLAQYSSSYAIYSASAFGVAPKHLHNLSPGRIVTFENKKKYALTDILENTLFQCEGELFTIPRQQRFGQLEFAGDNRLMALVNIYDKTTIEVYSGKYYEFEELNFTQLRPLHEWE